MNIPPPAQNNQMPAVIQNIGNSLNQAVGQVKSGFNDTVTGFNSQVAAGTAATQGFLQSNTIIAKFAFILLIIIVFIFLFVLGINLIQYFLDPPTAPYVIYGMIDGNSGKIVSTDPSKKDSVAIALSNNKTTGLEFTWSFWLNVSGLGPAGTYQNIFNKGDNSYDTNGIAKVNNAPGVYLTRVNADGAPQGQLRIIMDTVTDNAASAAQNYIDIPNIPLSSSTNLKWFHVALRMQNTILDVYINGVVSNRLIMPQVPKQNYNDINICQNGGFTGKLSNLQYFPYALNAFDINRLIYSGPNTSQNIVANSNATYLSTKWYTNNM